MKRLVPEHFKADGSPKHPYPSAAEAVQAAMNQQAWKGTRDHPYQAYECPRCRNWHIGRRPTNPTWRQDRVIVPPRTLDIMRVELRRAGWRPTGGGDVERWLAPGITGKKKAGRKKTLPAAYAAMSLAE